MEDKNKLGTIIHGIFASEHLDSSGEVLSIDGMDISSLGSADSIFNFEHNSKENPVQVVGKVTFAKKIFKKSDCENKDQEYFWDFCQKPFVYGKGELFDHPDLDHDGARNAAALLRYDNRDKGEKSRRLVSFSIEGGKMEKKGMVVTKSIARDVAITIKHCNKMCIVEILDDIKLRKDLYKNQKNNTDMKKVDGFRESIMADVKKGFPDLKDSFNEKVDKFKDTKSFRQKSKVSEKITNQASKPTAQPKMASPKREFTSGNAPDKMKVGDRINYKKMSTGKDIYNNPNTWKSENNMRKAIVAGMMGGSPDSKTGMAALASEEIVGDSRAKKKELKKGLKTLSFPKLGVESTPRAEVKRIEPQSTTFGVKSNFPTSQPHQPKQIKDSSGQTLTQADVEAKKYANKKVQSVKDHPKMTPDKAKEITQNSQQLISKELQKPGSAGKNVRTVTGSVNQPYDYSKGVDLSQRKDGNFKGNFRNTEQHEAIHGTFSRIARKMSPDHENSLSRYILDTKRKDSFFDPKDIDAIKNFIGPKYQGRNRVEQEFITGIQDLLTNPKKSQLFHDKFSHMKSGDIHPKKAQQLDNERMKRLKAGWKKMTDWTENLDEKTLNSIHTNYSKQNKQKQ